MVTLLDLVVRAARWAVLIGFAYLIYRGVRKWNTSKIGSFLRLSLFSQAPELKAFIRGSVWRYAGLLVGILIAIFAADAIFTTVIPLLSHDSPKNPGVIFFVFVLMLVPASVVGLILFSVILRSVALKRFPGTVQNVAGTIFLSILRAAAIVVAIFFAIVIFLDRVLGW